MILGLVGGSGGHSWPGLEGARTERVATDRGDVEVTRGEVAGTQVVHWSRHGAGHERLSSAVDHRAGLAALLACGVGAVVATTVCGAVDPDLELGSLVVFDDLHFPANRLPDGGPCTWFDEPGDPRRGHWIYDLPFSAGLRAALLEGAAAAPEVVGAPVVDGGCYGHVDGPRFNTRAEVRQLAAAGVGAISQTAGPEVVLAGEAELPLALVGFLTDRANGVGEPEPVDALLGRMAHSAAAFAGLVAAAAPVLAAAAPGSVAAPGVVHRMAP